MLAEIRWLRGGGDMGDLQRLRENEAQNALTPDELAEVEEINDEIQGELADDADELGIGVVGEITEDTEDTDTLVAGINGADIEDTEDTEDFQVSVKPKKGKAQ